MNREPDDTDNCPGCGQGVQVGLHICPGLIKDNPPKVSPGTYDADPAAGLPWIPLGIARHPAPIPDDSGRIQVVTAVLIDTKERRLFLAQRPPGRDQTWKWETPGGKVEPNETPREAVRRELYEELGLDVDLNRIETTPLASVRVDMADKRIRLTMWHVLDWKGRPRSRDGQGWGWFTADEVRGLTLALGNHKTRDTLLAFMEFYCA